MQLSTQDVCVCVCVCVRTRTHVCEGVFMCVRFSPTFIGFPGLLQRYTACVIVHQRITGYFRSTEVFIVSAIVILSSLLTFFRRHAPAFINNLLSKFGRARTDQKHVYGFERYEILLNVNITDLFKYFSRWS